MEERGVAASEREQEKAERCCVVVWRSAVSLESVSAPRCGMMACTPPWAPCPHMHAQARTYARTQAWARASGLTARSRLRRRCAGCGECVGVCGVGGGRADSAQEFHSLSGPRLGAKRGSEWEESLRTHAPPASASASASHTCSTARPPTTTLLACHPARPALAPPSPRNRTSRPRCWWTPRRPTRSCAWPMATPPWSLTSASLCRSTRELQQRGRVAARAMPRPPRRCGGVQAQAHNRKRKQCSPCTLFTAPSPPPPPPSPPTAPPAHCLPQVQRVCEPARGQARVRAAPRQLLGAGAPRARGRPASAGAVGRSFGRPGAWSRGGGGWVEGAGGSLGVLGGEC